MVLKYFNIQLLAVYVSKIKKQKKINEFVISILKLRLIFFLYQFTPKLFQNKPKV